MIDEVIQAIPEIEYNTLRDNLQEMTKAYGKYRNSAKAIVEQFQMFAPKTAADISDKIQNFDIEKMQNVLALADSMGINNTLKGAK